jgi:hypothetical protein
MKKRWLMIGLVFLALLPTASGMAQSNSAAVQIESVTDEGFIVLGDTTFTLAPNARFFAQDERTPVAFSTFKEGDWVEFSINSDGEINEMWLSSENR